MRPPDQIPNLKPCVFDRGETCYLWTGKNYSEKKVVTQHHWKSALTLQDGISQLIVDPSWVISAEQFYEEQREEARVRYDWIITHWNNGLRTSKAMAEKTGESARSIGQMIAAAKRWNLLTPDEPKP